MNDNSTFLKAFNSIIRARRTTREFSSEIPNNETMIEILESALYAPFGGATGISLRNIRTIRVLSLNTETRDCAQELLLSQIRTRARILRTVLLLAPFLRKRMKSFETRITNIAENGIPSLTDGAYYIIIAEKKGFPNVAEQSIAHAMQNMWLSATANKLGFQLISATGMMSKNKRFMKLLKLKVGEYAIDGCVIGVPKKHNKPLSDRNMDDLITWL